MRKINATEFKTKCFSFLDDIANRGAVFRIVKRGKVVAEIRPVSDSNVESPQAALKGSIEILGDVIGPVVDEREIKLEKGLL